MKTGTKIVITVVALTGILFLLVFGAVILMSGPGANQGNGANKMPYDTARAKLTDLARNVQAANIAPVKGKIDITQQADVTQELPDISTYKPTVQGYGEIDLRIISSTEKTGNGKDVPGSDWFNIAADRFNKAGITVNGRSVSVTVYSIASGAAYDYIRSGKYVPDAYTPANELWGTMIQANGIQIEEREKRLVGNLPGIVMQNDKYAAFIAKYGELNMKTLVQATVDNYIAVGYTNPLASSTGLYFLLSTLLEFDKSNPLSQTAVDGFNQFQLNVPFVAYSTVQMQDAVSKSQSLDTMALEYQQYKNTPVLSNYKFIPFGMRHDSPMYALGALSEDKSRALDRFDEFCLNKDSQALADRDGFNGMPEYQGADYGLPGNTIIAAQKLWKENKDAGKPIAAVFIADISGSMDGQPLNQLKESLVNSIQYINSKNCIGLVTFNSNVYVNLPIGLFDVNQKSLFAGSVGALSAGGGTATYNAVITAMDMLDRFKTANPDVKPMIFLLTDGEQNQGYSLSSVSRVIGGLNIPIYTIGYNANIEVLKEISSINEAATINASSDDVIYQLKNLFNAQM